MRQCSGLGRWVDAQEGSPGNMKTMTNDDDDDDGDGDGGGDSEGSGGGGDDHVDDEVGDDDNTPVILTSYPSL